MREWITSAMAFAGINQSELQRRLSDRFGWPEGRSKINKLLSTQQLTAEEMFQIADVTGFPPPSGLNRDSSDWRPHLHSAVDMARKMGAADNEILERFAALIPLAIVPVSAQAGTAPVEIPRQTAEQLNAALSAIQEILAPSKNRD